VQLEIFREQPTASSGERSHGPTLVCVHGAWSSGAVFARNFLPHLARQGFDAVAPSLRGHGGSEGRKGLRWASVADYLDDIHTVVTDLPRPVVLAGLSMGGFLCQLYAEEHPALVAGLALLASVPPHGAAHADKTLRRANPRGYMKALLTLTSQKVMDSAEVVRRVCFSPSMPEEDARRFYEDQQPESARVSLEITWGRKPDPAKLTCPVLVLGGELDVMFPPSEAQKTAAAYGVEPVIFPGMGHVMPLEPDWQLAADALAEWARGLKSPG
jgi:hypothetical protein